MKFSPQSKSTTQRCACQTDGGLSHPDPPQSKYSFRDQEKSQLLNSHWYLCCLKFVSFCFGAIFTPEYAARVSGKHSPLMERSCVPGCGRRPAGSGLCSAGNSTSTSWQTLAPPKIKMKFQYVKYYLFYPNAPQDVRKYSTKSC